MYRLKHLETKRHIGREFSTLEEARAAIKAALGDEFEARRQEFVIEAATNNGNGAVKTKQKFRATKQDRAYLLSEANRIGGNAARMSPLEADHLIEMIYHVDRDPQTVDWDAILDPDRTYRDWKDVLQGRLGIPTEQARAEMEELVEEESVTDLLISFVDGNEDGDLKAELLKEKNLSTIQSLATRDIPQAKAFLEEYGTDIVLSKLGKDIRDIRSELAELRRTVVAPPVPRAPSAAPPTPTPYRIKYLPTGAMQPVAFSAPFEARDYLRKKLGAAFETKRRDYRIIEMIAG